MGVIGSGQADRTLLEAELRAVVAEAAEALAKRGGRVLVLVPDGTRSMPMPLMRRLIEELLAPRVDALDYLVALGTHRPMTDAALSRLLGCPVNGGRAGRARVFNHESHNPEALALLGTLAAREVAELTGGRLNEEVPVRLNRLVLEYDQLLVCGPVFPHEVVGFSGGNKYFFPGIAGPEVINLTHWLGALISSYEVIGSGYTPVRAVIDRAAALIDRPKSCLALVVTHAGVAGLYFGTPHEAWAAAAALSARVHVVYAEKPFRRVLSVMPTMYEDLWTAAKGMYKVEPVVADGGEVVIFAPHLTEVSYAHGRLLDEIGYHCRDYFTAQWDRFKGYPGGILAHSTHLKGLGRYDAASGVETPRVRVTLATSIPEKRCRRLNLGYLNPAGVNVDEWKGREDEGVLVVPRAGEILYRVRPSGAGHA
ncbi:MAG: lactate racemase domain-containing protein [Vicinamibacteria bacterium]